MMVRVKLVGLALLALPLFAKEALAIEWWHDPDRGCGTLDGWQRTNRLKDLPGCDGELPKGAPPGEVAMREAKKALHDAEKILDSGQITDVEAKLEAATATINKAPNDPRVNWARPHYKLAVNILKARLNIVPRMPKLRTAYKAAMDAADAANKQRTDATRKAALTAADACVTAFREAEQQGADLSIPVELTPGRSRPMRDDLRDCANGKTSLPPEGTAPPTKPEDAAKPDAAKPDAAKPDAAKPDAAKGGGDLGVPRAKWLKALKGDRKKVFNDHPDAYPSFEGDQDLKGATKAAEWRYGAEVFTFKKNKLAKPKKQK